jgi:DNA-binding MarR family transcriptional regulator
MPADAAEDVDHRVVTELRLAVARLGRQLRQQGPPDQVTLSQLSALYTIANHGDITLGELAEREQVKPPTMSRLVAALEEGGYIVRTTDATDRRSVRVDLTPKGRRLIERRRSERDAFLTQRVATLSSEDRASLPQVVEILRHLLA